MLRKEHALAIDANEAEYCAALRKELDAKDQQVEQLRADYSASLARQRQVHADAVQEFETMHASAREAHVKSVATLKEDHAKRTSPL